jgi:hypothetical protein
MMSCRSDHLQERSTRSRHRHQAGQRHHPVNLRSWGVIAVAILTTDYFDATTVDASTVKFPEASAKPSQWHRQPHKFDLPGSEARHNTISRNVRTPVLFFSLHQCPK